MNLTTRSQSAYSLPTTKSADDTARGGVIRVDASVNTQTEAVPFELIYVDFERQAPEALNGEATIEDLVAEAEANESDRAELAKARGWIADTFYSEQPNSLRALRLKAGLSQAKLATLVQTTQSHIARIESGAIDPQLGTVRRLAEALKTDLMAVVTAAVYGQQKK